MEQILIVRETVVKFLKRYETFIIPVLKFFLGVFIFNRIHTIGFPNTELFPFLSVAPSLPAVMLLGLAFALLPYTLSYLLIIADITLQYSANLQIAAVVFLFLLCILLFYARMAAKESILIVLTVLAFYFKVPYLIPILVGLYFSLTAIIPVTIGVFINEYIPVVQSLATTTRSASLSTGTDFNLTEIPASFTETYTSVLNSLTVTNGWIFTAFIFAMVIVIVYVVSRLSIDFSKEIAILLGCVLNIFGFIMAVLVAKETVGLAGMIVGTIICGALAELFRFLDAVLDYQRAESVQFEDENNYYYVRVVPKVVMTKRKRVVRRIRPQPEEDE